MKIQPLRHAYAPLTFALLALSTVAAPTLAQTRDSVAETAPPRRLRASDVVRSTTSTSNGKYRDLVSTGVIPKRRRPAPNVGFVPRHEQDRSAGAVRTGTSWQAEASDTLTRGVGARANERGSTLEPISSEIRQVLYDETVEGAGEYLEGEFPIGPAGGDCVSCGGCQHCTPGHSWLGRFEFFVGSHGFTGPVNRGETGSFGFHEGLNWSRPLWHLTHGLLTAQIGFRATQSNLSGSTFGSSIRHQSFLTGGIFRRSDWGLQGGIVLDHLTDDFYEDLSVTQLRGELSWKFPCDHELGFWFTAATRDEGVATDIVGQLQLNEGEWQPNDILAFFYRRRLCQPGAEARFYVGATSNSDAILGGDLRLPLTPCLTLRNSLTYQKPRESDSYVGPANEAWNVALTLVWTPYGGPCIDYSRPLLDVADNGSFLVDRR